MIRASVVTTLAVAVATGAGAARADKLDDAYERVDLAAKALDAQRANYDRLQHAWELAYKPVEDQWKVVIAAKKAMDGACAGAGHGTPPCSHATLAWAAEVKKRQSLEYRANELDPKHEATFELVNRATAEVNKAQANFDAVFEQAKKIFADARAHAKTPADRAKLDRSKLDQELANREAARQNKFAQGTSSAADAKNRGTGGSSSSSSGHSIGGGTISGPDFGGGSTLDSH